jgi:hypothetical protein
MTPHCSTTHGFGSFCSSGAATGGHDSTIGTERHRNDALTSDDEDGFVERLVAALTAYPAYYAHMAPLNLNGPREPGAEAPHTAEPDELAKRIEAGVAKPSRSASRRLPSAVSAPFDIYGDPR